MRRTTDKPRKERKENAERRRRQLLDAACRSIAKHGLAKTTLATVSEEAGLSQGVVVFYFNTKADLLTETFRDLYKKFENDWSAALAQPGTPVERFLAVLESEFHPEGQSLVELPIWYAFWGEMQSVQGYAEIARSFDERHNAAMVGLWGEILPETDPEVVARIAEWVEVLCDGYWHNLHIAPDRYDAVTSLASIKFLLARQLPDVFGHLMDEVELTA